MIRQKTAHQRTTLLYQCVPRWLKMFSFRQLKVSSSVTCSGRGGAHLRRLMANGEDIVTLRQVRTRSGATRQEWSCPALALLTAAVRRSRVKVVCAGCQGEGCSACIQTGFVPEDESPVKSVPNNPALDLGDPWTWTDTAEEDS